MLKFLFSLTLTLFLTGCSRPYLHVYTQYLTRSNLASYHVKTPDPLLNCPPVGQRVIISWSIAKDWLCDPNLHLEIIIRLRNHDQRTLKVPIKRMVSSYIVPVMNQEYFDTRGVATYKVSIVGSEGVLKVFEHQLWVEWISHSEGEEKEQPIPDKL